MSVSGEPSGRARPSGPQAEPGEGGRFLLEGEAVVFGFPNTPARLTIVKRPKAWRVRGAAQRLAVFVVIAPFTALVPPHAPWLIGSLTAGVILARRRWSERFTLERVEGTCPKCGEPLAVKSGRLKLPHGVSCEACHHESTLRFPESALQTGSASSA